MSVPFESVLVGKGGAIGHHLDGKRAWRTFEPIVLAVPESYKGDAISRPVNEEQHTFLEIERQDQLTGAIQERRATERSG